jgi:hypothetical protein
LPSRTTADDATPDVLLEDSPPYAERQPVNYVLALEPGEYGLATFTIKVASSVTDMKIVSVGRARLSEGRKQIGGTFNVKAGELVYIGHFGATIKQGMKGSITTRRRSKSSIRFWLRTTCSFDCLRRPYSGGTMYCLDKSEIEGSRTASIRTAVHHWPHLLRLVTKVMSDRFLVS